MSKCVACAAFHLVFGVSRDGPEVRERAQRCAEQPIHVLPWPHAPSGPSETVEKGLHIAGSQREVVLDDMQNCPVRQESIQQVIADGDGYRLAHARVAHLVCDGAYLGGAPLGAETPMEVDQYVQLADALSILRRRLIGESILERLDELMFRELPCRLAECVDRSGEEGLRTHPLGL